jgi:AraC-like DNA-binding protein
MNKMGHLTREGFDHLLDVSYRSVTVDQLRISFHGLRYDFQHDFPIASHIHDFFEFHYILDGSVKTRVNEVERTYFPGQFYVMTPLSIHSHAYFKPPDNTCESFALRWKLERVGAEQTNPDLDLVKFVLDKAPAVAIDDLDDSIANMLDHIIVCAMDHCTRIELLLKLSCLVVAVSNRYAALQETVKPLPAMPDSTQNILLASVAYIERHCNEPISASDVAAHIPISYSHLARLFSQYMKSSVNTYITRVKIDRASHLLMTTDMSINEVAREIGYSSLSYFSSTFKNTLGQSPKEYRFRYRQRYFQGDPAVLM